MAKIEDFIGGCTQEEVGEVLREAWGAATSETKEAFVEWLTDDELEDLGLQEIE